MDCLRCKEEMIKAKLKGDAVGTVVYLTNKKIVSSFCQRKPFYLYVFLFSYFDMNLQES